MTGFLATSSSTRRAFLTRAKLVKQACSLPHLCIYIHIYGKFFLTRLKKCSHTDFLLLKINQKRLWNAYTRLRKHIWACFLHICSMHIMVHVCTYIHTYITYITYIHIHAHTYTHTHIHIHTHMHIYTNTHTHTYRIPDSLMSDLYF